MADAAGDNLDNGAQDLVLQDPEQLAALLDEPIEAQVLVHPGPATAAQDTVETTTSSQNTADAAPSADPPPTTAADPTAAGSAATEHAAGEPPGVTESASGDLPAAAVDLIHAPQPGPLQASLQASEGEVDAPTTHQGPVPAFVEEQAQEPDSCADVQGSEQQQQQQPEEAQQQQQHVCPGHAEAEDSADQQGYNEQQQQQQDQAQPPDDGMLIDAQGSALESLPPIGDHHVASAAGAGAASAGAGDQELPEQAEQRGVAMEDADQRLQQQQPPVSAGEAPVATGAQTAGAADAATAAAAAGPLPAAIEVSRSGQDAQQAPPSAQATSQPSPQRQTQSGPPSADQQQQQQPSQPQAGAAAVESQAAAAPAPAQQQQQQQCRKNPPVPGLDALGLTLPPAKRRPGAHVFLASSASSALLWSGDVYEAVLDPAAAADAGVPASEPSAVAAAPSAAEGRAAANASGWPGSAETAPVQPVAPVATTPPVVVPLPAAAFAKLGQSGEQVSVRHRAALECIFGAGVLQAGAGSLLR